MSLFALASYGSLTSGSVLISVRLLQFYVPYRDKARKAAYMRQYDAARRAVKKKVPAISPISARLLDFHGTLVQILNIAPGETIHHRPLVSYCDEPFILQGLSWDGQLIFKPYLITPTASRRPPKAPARKPPVTGAPVRLTTDPRPRQSELSLYADRIATALEPVWPTADSPDRDGAIEQATANLAVPVPTCPKCGSMLSDGACLACAGDAVATLPEPETNWKGEVILPWPSVHADPDPIVELPAITGADDDSTPRRRRRHPVTRR